MKSPDPVRYAKSGKEVAKGASGGGGKLSSTHWLTRVYRPKYTNPDGSMGQVAMWWARLSHAGRRHAVSLQTADKRQAATKAATLFAQVIGEGWDSALASLDPDRHANRKGGTVGDVLAALDRADLRDRTRANYVNCLRWWAARHLEMKPGRKEFARNSEGWRERINGVSLADLTIARVEEIRDRFIEAGKASGDAKAELRARVSVKSYLRNAKAGIGAAVKLAKMTIPDPRPFSGVTVSGAQVTQYRSKIDAGALLRDAQSDLAQSEPDVYAVILLALGAGLRRAEIENLRWGSVDEAEGRVWVEASGTWQPKTQESEGGVDVDVGLLKALGVRGGDEALVIGPGATEAAVRWLRSRGFDMNKPIHTLRKEFGSIVCHTADLITASKQLRHRSLAVTAQVYVESRRKSAPAIGQMLGEVHHG